MRRRFGFILLVVFGSFFVYCAQNVVGDMRGGNGGNGNGGSGMVGNAGADACCTPPDPPAGTVLFDQQFMTADCYSPTIDLAGNRTIVIHGYAPTVAWSFGGAAGWVTQTGVTSTQEVTMLDGRMGKQIRISYPTTCNGSAGCGCVAQAQSLTVVGYKQ